MEDARSAYEQVLVNCRNEMCAVYHEHWQQRRPRYQMPQEGGDERDKRILNELSAKDMRGMLEARGFEFPYAMVRSEMGAAKKEYLRPHSDEELMRAYMAGVCCVGFVSMRARVSD